jgi:hypothetical protein
MRLPILILGVLTAVVVILDIWATRTVTRQLDLSPQQRRSQILFIWLLPVIGAWIAIEINRHSQPAQQRPRLVADEIHPLVEQAARPVADGETRAAEQYIERELTDFGRDAPSDSHSDGFH